MHRTIRDSSWLIALWAFIIALPVYELLAPHPEFFIAHDIDGVRVLAFIGFVSFGAPMVLLVILVLARASGSRIYLATLTVLLLLLAAVFGLGAGAKLSIGWPALAIAAALAIAGWALLFRVVRGDLVPTPVLWFVTFGIPLWFLWTLADAGIFITKTSKPEFAISTKADVPIVLFILDELPQTTLLDDDERIDAKRFPNLARFAATSTWYRNTTTVGESTEVAVPAILAGVLPDKPRVPIHTAYPHNLFTLLAGDYVVNATEPYTRLCPDEICPGNREILMVALKSTLLDTLVVLAHIVVPDPWSKALPPITQDWKGFWPDAKVPAGSDLAQRLHVLTKQNHERILRKSLSDLRSSPRLFFFRHLALPHIPWRYTHTGQEYIYGTLDGILDDRWLEDQWFVNTAYQRHLLQTSYTDSLVGLLIDRLEELSLFDDALIVILADHGSGFTANRERRRLTPTNAAEIANVPLLIKYPNQHNGIVDDRRVQTIDILPTILSVVGANFEGRLAGQDLKSANFQEPERRLAYKVSGRAISLKEPDLMADRVRAKSLKNEMFAHGDTNERSWYAMGPFANLVGVRSRELWRHKSASKMILDYAKQYENIRFDGTPLPLNVRGVLLNDSAASQAERDVAVVINDRVAGVTKAVPVGNSQAVFSAMVHPSSLSRGRNDVAVGVIVKSDQGVELHRVEPATQRAFHVRHQNGDSFLVDGEGKKWPTVEASREGPLVGWLEQSEGKGEYLHVSGWAADIAHQSSPEVIVITVDGVAVATTVTTVNRDDVVASLGSQQYLTTGFHVEIPKNAIPSSGARKLEAYAIGDGVAVKLAKAGSFP